MHLARFFERVRPPGWWGGLGGEASRRAARWIGAGRVGGLAVRLTLAATRKARQALGVEDEMLPGAQTEPPNAAVLER